MGLISGRDLQFAWYETGGSEVTEPQVNNWAIDHNGLIEVIKHSGLQGGVVRCQGITKWDGAVAGIGGGWDPGGSTEQSPLPFPNDTGQIRAAMGLSQEGTPVQVVFRGNVIVNYLDIFVPCAGYHGNSVKYQYGFKSDGHLYGEDASVTGGTITNSAVPHCHSSLRCEPRISASGTLPTVAVANAIWARLRIDADVRPYSDTSQFEDIGGGDYRGTEKHLPGTIDCVVQIAYHHDTPDTLKDLSADNEIIDILVRRHVSGDKKWRIKSCRYVGRKSGASVDINVPKPTDASKNAHFIDEWKFNIMGDGSALGSIVDPNGTTKWPPP